MVGGCLTAIALAGCGATVVDATKVENAIRARASNTPFDLSVKSVDCPAGRQAKRGDTFTCTLTLTDGESVPFRVTEQDSSGHVTFQNEDEVATYVENAITSRLAAHRIQSSASCPQHIAIAVGATFTCSLVSGTQHGLVTVTITDLNGTFSIGRPRNT